MPTQSKIPTSWSDDAAVGTVAWSNPGNAAASDDARASASLTSSSHSHYLKGVNCGFDAFTSGATINSITYSVERRNTGSGTAKDEKLYPVVGGSVDATTNFADAATSYPIPDTVKDHLQTTNLPTAAQILASDFGVVLQVNETSGILTATPEVDVISITVDYTPAVTAINPSKPFPGVPTPILAM